MSKKGVTENKVEKANIQKIEWCQSCGWNKAEELHTCPYKEEINNDSATLCNCCKECKYDCLRDI